jgi:hypothetical protein
MGFLKFYDLGDPGLGRASEGFLVVDVSLTRDPSLALGMTDYGGS